MRVFDWVWQIALKKAVTRGLKAGIAIIAAPSILAFLAQHGVTITINQGVLEASIVALAISGYEFSRNWLKTKNVKLI